MGFCLFNNVAIAAAFALHEHGLKRVLIVDWDVHHGNGTMHSFFDTDTVLYFSIHQYPHYPGTGAVAEIGRGSGKGYTVNVPLPGGQGDADYLYIFREIFVPIAREYAPELILISAGFDTHRNDPLASMGLSSAAYGAFTELLQGVADQCCPGHLAITLEGGYDHTALSEGVAAVLSNLVSGESHLAELQAGDQVNPDTRMVAEEVRRVHSPYWSCCSEKLGG
jgi:acetoin utilization deacetylase AcuC-like enzyme